MAKLKALILAGGFGKRLRLFTSEMPKPMLEVAGRPLIEWQMQWLKKKNGIDDLVLCVGYLKEKIMRYVGDGSRFGMSVVYSTEDKMLGTGSPIKNAQSLFSSESGFYVVNGDILSTIDLAKLAGDTHAIAAVQMRDPFGVISTIDGNKDVSFVKEFLQKPLMDNVWINADVYYFKSGIPDHLPEAGDCEASVLPLLARQAALTAVKFDKQYYWRSIDSHMDLEEAAKEVPSFSVV